MFDARNLMIYRGRNQYTTVDKDIITTCSNIEWI